MTRNIYINYFMKKYQHQNLIIFLFEGTAFSRASKVDPRTVIVKIFLIEEGAN